MKTIKQAIQKTKYYIYVICLVVNIPFAIEGNFLNFFTIGFCTGLIFFSIVNDDII